MRVISGTAKGRRLVAPKRASLRPATDRLKEALFNILFEVDGDRVLDLFAGTGSLAIEALSRGAAYGTLVEEDPVAVEAIRRNLEVCGFGSRADVAAMDVNTFLAGDALDGPRHGDTWNLVFCDPPYAIDLKYLETLASGLACLDDAGILGPDACVVFERRTGDALPPLPDGFELRLQRAYGQTSLYVAERRSSAHDARPQK